MNNSTIFRFRWNSLTVPYSVRFHQQRFLRIFFLDPYRFQVLWRNIWPKAKLSKREKCWPSSSSSRISSIWSDDCLIININIEKYNFVWSKIHTKILQNHKLTICWSHILLTGYGYVPHIYTVKNPILRDWIDSKHIKSFSNFFGVMPINFPCAEKIEYGF